MHGNVILTLLLQIVLILALSRLMGLVFRYFRQPIVMGEMVAGIMLGPSLLGLLLPGVSRFVFPPESIPYLNILSQVGVIFFLFLIGLELDPQLLRNRGHVALVISHVSIIAPFLLGAVLALYLYPNLFNDAPKMPFTSVALFMGAAMSITAFPVLARILTERNIHKTRIGAIAITCAAVDDVTAWCMLAFVVGIARADGIGPGLRTAAMAVVYVLVMFFAVRPFLRRLQRVYDRQGGLTQNVVAIILLLILASAYTTELIGIHALFGAFLMGAMMPKGSRFVRSLSEKLEDYTVVFLLPIFFAYTGLRTQIGLLDRPELWVDTLLIILVACAGKFGGSALAGRVTGLGWREAAVIGILMNTRGLMELVILNIGLQEGVITPAVFAMMVIMALVTTALTTPVLNWLAPPRFFEAQAPAPGEGEAKPEAKPPYTILIPVSKPETGVALARIARTLIGDGDGRVLALHLRPPAEYEAYRSAAGIEEAGAQHDPSLMPLLNEAAKEHLPAEPMSFVAQDVASAVAAVARARDIDLVLIGFHVPVFSATILGGTVHRVLTQTPSDVAILVDRGLTSPKLKKILVPFLGSPHDRKAIELAARMARHTAAAVTVLHVVAHHAPRSVAGEPLDAKTAVDKVFKDPSQPAPVTFRVIEDASPVDAVLREAAGYDLVVIGVAEQWGLESHLLSFRRERIASECPTSLLIVRSNNAER